MSGGLGGGGGMQLLPPAPDVCQECAVKHDPEQAHNKDSLYYQYHFYSKNGRWPVWKDAIAHCDPELRERWEEEIKKVPGAWEEPGPPEAAPMDDGTIGTTTYFNCGPAKPSRSGKRRKK